MDCDGNRCIFWTLTNKMFVFIGTKKMHTNILVQYLGILYSKNVRAAFAVTATDRYGK